MPRSPGQEGSAARETLPGPFAQDGCRCRLAWGPRGAREAAARGDILVVVDVLRFSTTVATAAARGVLIFPCGWREPPGEVARRIGAAAPRSGAEGRYSLSPRDYLDAVPGTRVVLPSPNGAICMLHGREAPHLLVGALVNASAVAAHLDRLLARHDGGATVLACGERWPADSEEGNLRFALEDYLGAGAILARTTAARSAEAEVCAGAFTAAADRLPDLLWDCGSGRELRGKGLGEDIVHAARMDLYSCVPVRRGEGLEALSGEEADEGGSPRAVGRRR